MADTYLSKLNERQLEAVKEITHPVRVIAGAGSGKTRVITTKIVYLKEKLKCHLSEILALTFTRKAAEEMRTRILTMIDTVEKTNIMTFHALCYLILTSGYNDVGLKRNFEILDSYTQDKILKTIFGDLDRSERGIIKREISNIKNNYFEIIDIYNNANKVEKYDNDIITKYNIYQNYIRENNKIDYDDLMLYSYKILKENQSLRQKWINSFKYILVDEFQDTNYLQISLVELLLNERPAITIVGDPDQTIYTWRGAKQEIILEFEKKFTNTKTIVLDQNYRSTKQILDAANMVIKNNNKRYEKNLHTKKIEGDSIDVVGFEEIEQQNEYIANRVLDMVKETVYKYKDFFILTRSNKQIKNIELTLNYYQIPYVVRGSDSFFTLRIIIDSLFFLRALTYKDDNSALAVLEQLPKIGPAKLLKIKQICVEKNTTVFEWLLNGDHTGYPSSVDKIAITFQKCEGYLNSDYSLKKFAETIFQDVGIMDRANLEKEKNNHHARLLELLEILARQDAEFCDISLYDKLTNFLVNVTINSDVMQNDDDVDAIHISTIHGAKGMEKPIVIIYDVNGFNFPNFKSGGNSSYIEEERRTFYVAITRAKEKLLITYNSKFSSIFIAELNENISRHFGYDSRRNNKFIESEKAIANCDHINTILDNNLAIGDRITHDYFGEGIILDVMVKNIKVAFKNRGVKFIPLLSGTWKKAISS